MPVVRIFWRFYRVIIFPILHALSGGGTQSSCRHDPSCSVYAVQVIEQDGWLKGSLKALRRVLSCHPWGR